MPRELTEHESRSRQTTLQETSHIERDLNEVVPILAHGLVRRLEQKGLARNVRVQAMAGDDWGVAKSPENTSNIPNVIIYDRSALSDDRRLLNARLRHEIGHLNYPIEDQLNVVRDWCSESGVAPQLVTSLVEAVHEASVNYFEMQNSHSSQPVENFKALYEQDINTHEIASTIGSSLPYKQVIDLTLLYSLSSVGLISEEHFALAVQNADPRVQHVFDHDTLFTLDNLVKVAVPQKKIQLIIELLWPKVAELALLMPDAKVDVSAMKDEIEDIQMLLAQKSQSKTQNNQNRSETKSRPQISPEERQERQEYRESLAQDFADQLKDIQEKAQELLGQNQQKKDAEKTHPPSLKDIQQQAQQTKDEIETQQPFVNQETSEQLEDLKEQLAELADVAKQTEVPSEEPEGEVIEDETMTYNIREVGIDESSLDEEQLELLNKLREFAQNTSKTYRKMMRLLMKGYQRHNPQFTERIFQEMMLRGYDLPAFTIYSPEAAAQFLSDQPELGVGAVHSGTFLLNFNLPRPIGRFWYRGGNGKLSKPVNEGEIEWGHFYRSSMPAIWNSVDLAFINRLFLDRINQFGQHNHNSYYYLWEAELIPPHDEKKAETEPNSAEERSENESEMGSGSESTQSSQESDAAQKLQEALEQAKEKLSSAEGPPSPSAEQQLSELAQDLNNLKQALQEGAEGQDLTGKMEAFGQQLSEMMKGQLGEELSQGSDQAISEGDPQGNEKLSGGQSDAQGFEKAQVNQSPQSQDRDHGGGAGNTGEEQGTRFSKPDPQLLEELRNLENTIGSKFSSQREDGEFQPKDFTEKVRALTDQQVREIEQRQSEQLSQLDTLKKQHQAKMEALYREMSGLSGEALRVYVAYMESMKELTDDLTNFFIEKFQLDKEYIYTRNQRRGARLQRGWTQNILGMKDGRPVVNPRSFERKSPPSLPQFVWTIVLDNTGSVGDMIEDEKKLAVALIEVTKRLNIPFEVVVYTEGGFMFLKTFDQEGYGDDLQKIVLLRASITNQQDTDLLRAAYASQTKFANQLKRSQPFIFFLTDGLACSPDSLHALVQKFKPETVILGVGLAGGAQTIKKEFGNNALEIPDPKDLSIKFIRKLEDLVDQTFD